MIDLIHSENYDITGYIGFGNNSAFTLRNYGDLIFLLRGLAKPYRFNNEAKFNIYSVGDDRTCIMLGSSLHYIPDDMAELLAAKLQAIVNDPDDAEFIGALNAAYGE